jgi:hypothetical protein
MAHIQNLIKKLSTPNRSAAIPLPLNLGCLLARDVSM